MGVSPIKFCSVDYMPSDYDLVIREDTKSFNIAHFNQAKRELLASIDCGGCEGETSRFKPSSVQPEVKQPEEDDFEQASFIEEVTQGGFAHSFQQSKVPSLTVEVLLQLAEGRILAKPDDFTCLDDLSLIPDPRLDIFSEPSNKLEINLVKVIRDAPKELEPKLPSKNPTKRGKIDLQSRRKRVLN